MVASLALDAFMDLVSLMRRELSCVKRVARVRYQVILKWLLQLREVVQWQPRCYSHVIEIFFIIRSRLGSIEKIVAPFVAGGDATQVFEATEPNFNGV